MEKNKLNWKRIVFSIIYAGLSISLIILLHQKIFYFEEEVSSWNLYRFLWCLCCTSLGFSAIAFHWRHKETSPYPEYITLYFPLIIVISSLIFGLLHLLERATGFIFYYLSGSLCFTLGFFIDSYKQLLNSFLEQWGKSKTRKG